MHFNEPFLTPASDEAAWATRAQKITSTSRILCSHTVTPKNAAVDQQTKIWLTSYLSTLMTSPQSAHSSLSFCYKFYHALSACISYSRNKIYLFCRLTGTHNQYLFIFTKGKKKHTRTFVGI